MSRAVIIFLAFVLVGFVNCVNLDKSCTPLGNDKNCINVYKCNQDDVVSALKAPSVKENRAYLSSLQCGWENNEPKICCKITADEEPCTTPSGTHGKCVELNSCPDIVALHTHNGFSSKLREYLNTINCGYTGKMPKICCTNEPIPINQL